MKSTKRILSAILSLCMILGCLAVGFTAQASASDLVDAIAAAAAGDTVNWTGGSVTLEDTLVIDKDVKVDFNGAVITGAPGKVAVQVNGDVTLYDGVIIADQGKFSGEMGFVKALMHYKPAIAVKGGDVVIECITAVGSLLRVPNSSSVELPIGNGICTDAGNVTIKNSIAVGMSGLDNDNLSSNVTVEDAILIGIFKAVNRPERVNFGGDNYTQYKTVDFLEGFLKDGVTLTPAEKKYIGYATDYEGDFSAASVLVNVADPSYGELTSTYVNGVLNVFAQADVSNEVEGVSNRYSYAYTPATCEVDDQTAAFELKDGKYVAQFEGLEENQEFDATANYDLSVKLGKQQKELVENALDMIAAYIDRAPELLYRFVTDFEALKDKAEMYAGLVYNVLVDNTTAAMFNLPDVQSLVLALFGETYTGYSEDGSAYTSPLQIIHELGPVFPGMVEVNPEGAAAFIKQYRNPKLAIFDTDGDGVADAPYAYTDDTVYAKADYYAGKPGYGSGVGLLEVFDAYYADLKDYIYGTSTTEFNDLEAAAEYVAINWEELYELVCYAVDFIDAAYVVLENDEDGIGALLKAANLGSFAGYIDQFKSVAAPGGYVHSIMNRIDEVLYSSAVQKYIGDEETAVRYCTTYTKKVWNIANNLDRYFDIDVKGDYVNVDFGHFTTGKVNTNVVEEGVRVSVDISGTGYATLGGETVGAYTTKYYEIGDEYTVSVADEYADKVEYIMIVTDGNRTIVDAPYTAKAATNIDIVVVFKSAFQQAGFDCQVSIMTDKALNYKFIQNVELGYLPGEDEAADIFADATVNTKAPDFKDLTLLGWSTRKDGSNVEATLSGAFAQIADDSTSAIIYAIYDYDEQVTVPTHKEAILMNGATVKDSVVYFEVSIQLKDGAEAVEAGVIATKNAALATKDAMTVDLAGTAGVAFLRTTKLDADGFVLPNVLYTAGVKTASGTVYGRGYVVYADGTVEYTDIASATV